MGHASQFFTHEKGQGLVEYALILVLIAIAVVAALTFLGSQVEAIFDYIGDELETPTP
ncbi:MAG: Flp family type IVb pilin [Chloroflexota bacterium]|nr:Flp family type IVb pilin [Chloroflexota bacterium]